MTKTKKLCALVVAALLLIVSAVCLIGFTAVRGEAVWTAKNGTTSISGNTISSGEGNVFVAEYQNTLDLANGFDLQFKVNKFSGTTGENWIKGDENSIGFALSAQPGSETAQKAYVFIFSKKADGNFALFTYYVNNFKIAADGTLSYTTNSLYYDNTTANSDFDAASAWTDGATLSLSGAELDGVPMFWLNGSMVNPFGGTIFDKNPASAAEYVKALEECYEGFAMDTSAMHLYAFSRTNQQAEFEIGIESMAEEYDAVKGGWFATDKAASEVIENGVHYSEIKGTNGMSRTRFIYGRSFDLTKENIEFTMSIPEGFKPDKNTFISVRGFGMNQLTTVKSVANRNYEGFYFSGGATLGLFDNGTREHAQAQGINAQPAPTAYANKDTVENGWLTRKIYFGDNGNGGYCYKVNGSTIVNYTAADCAPVLGDLTRVQITVMADEASATYKIKGEYKLSNFAQMPTTDSAEEVYVKDSGNDVTFTVRYPANVEFAKIEDASGRALASADYTLSEGTLTLKSTLLETLNNGVQTFKITTNVGTTLVLRVNVRSAVSLTPQTALKAKIGQFEDITVKVELVGEDAVRSIHLNGETLTDVLEGDIVTLSAEMLNRLHAGEYELTVVTENGSASVIITVEAIAQQAPVLGEGQEDEISVDLNAAEDIVVKVDLKDGADRYVLLNGRELSESEAVFAVDDSGKGTVTIPGSVVKTMAVGEGTDHLTGGSFVNIIEIATDGGTAVVYVTAELSLGDWTVSKALEQAPVLNEDGSVSMKGYTLLTKQENVDLSEGFTVSVKFGDIFDYSALTPSDFVEFVIYVKQAGVRIETHIRAYNTGDLVSTGSLVTVELFQQVFMPDGGQPVANDTPKGSVKLDKEQVWSIKLLDDTVLTMFNHKESRENGLMLSDVGNLTRFDNATIEIAFDTRASEEHVSDTTGSLIAFGAFNEERKDIPAWAKEYFLDALDAPVLKVEGNKVVWNAVEGAKQYIVYVDGEAAEIVSATEFDFTDYFSDGETHSIQVKAEGNGTTFGDSELSAAVELKLSGNGGNPGGDEPGNEEKPGEDEKKGCGSSITVSSAVSGGIVLLAAVAITLTLRKKED